MLREGKDVVVVWRTRSQLTSGDSTTEGRNCETLGSAWTSEMVGYGSAAGSYIPTIIIWASLPTEAALDPFGENLLRSIASDRLCSCPCSHWHFFWCH